jgi:hypothetical protein
MIFSSELDIRKTGHDQLLHVQSHSVLAIASVDTSSSRKLQTDVD